MWPILLFGAVLVFALKASSAAIVLSSAQTEVDLYDLRIDGSFGDFILGKEPVILPLQIRNTQPVPLSVNGFTGGAYVDEQLIGTTRLSSPAILPPYGELPLEVPIYLNPGPAVATLVTSLLSLSVPLLTIRGTLTVEGLPLPINETLSLKSA